MNILWLSHTFPYPPKGGVYQRSYNLIKETSQKHNVYLIAVSDRKIKNLSEAVEHFKGFCSEVSIIELPFNNLSKYFIALKSFFSLKPYTTQWIQNIEARKTIRHFIHKLNINVVHFDSIDVAPYIDEVKDLPKVLNHHNIESQMMMRRFIKEKNLLKKIYFFVEAIKLKKQEKILCAQFRSNVVVSNLDKDRLLKVCPSIKIDVIPNGVDINYFAPTQQNYEPNTLIFAGGMTWYPNRDAMQYFCNKIWPLIKTYYPDVKMTIIGRNPPKNILKLSRLDPNIIVTGFVDDIRPYAERTHVYVCPIRDGGGTKVKILDALAMGKPIVAHPIAIEGIDGKAGEHFLLAKTPAEFLQQISNLFDNHELCKRLSHNGRELAIEKYDFKKIGEKLSCVYESILSEVDIKQRSEVAQ